MAVEKIILDIQAQVKKAQQDINKLKGNTKGLNKEVDKTDKLMKKAGKALAAYFSIQAIVGFTKKIIEVRQEFEKYNAVLTVALGSAKAAAKEFEMIKKFAAETPFQVIQLTNAFVKLVNQGFKPTREEMRKLGDVAASTGKSFDQLTEAIIDATVGEFERLKEFGIRAQKMGDQVTFTFKEIRTQVDFTEDAIRQYILALGDLQGVSGSMAAISETLGGRISMLGDAWDSFLDTMGGRTSGTMIQVIDGLTNMINAMSGVIDETTTAQDRIDTFVDVLEGLTEEERRAAIVAQIASLEKAAEALVGVTEIGGEKVELMERDAETTKRATEQAVFFTDQIRLLKEQFEELAKVPPPPIIGTEEETSKRLAKEEKAHKERLKLLKTERSEKLAGLKEDQEVADEAFESLMVRLEKEAEVKKEFRDKRDQEIKDSLEDNLNKRLKISAKELEEDKARADAAIQIEEYKQLSKLDIIQGAFGLAQGLAGENATVQKILAIAESIISTFLSAQLAYASQVGIPIVGPALATAARRFAITQGLANTALIAGVTIAESFGEGGFTGKSKYQARDRDGRIAGYVHEDEFVFNKDKTRTLRPLFEDIHNNRIDIHGLAALTRRGTMRTVPKLNADILEQEVKKIYRKMSEHQPEKASFIYTDHGYTKKIGNTTINVST